MVKTLPSRAGGVSSIPGWGAKIPHATGAKIIRYYYMKGNKLLISKMNIECAIILLNRQRFCHLKI